MCCVDDMGLGKSVQALAVCACYRAEWPVLIVCPSSVRFAWRQQIERWLGPPPLQVSREQVRVVLTARDLNSASSALFHVMSYELLVRYTKTLSGTSPFRIVIMDESHFLKNYKSARTIAAQRVIQDAKRVLLLSGTPALSRPSELFCQLRAVRPRLFNNMHQFGLRYCAAQKKGEFWDYSGCSNMGELRLLMDEAVMIRRLKVDVMRQLPAKRREMIVLDPALVRKGKDFQRRHAQLASVDATTLGDRNGFLLEFYHETGLVKIPAVV